jgi:hypothetical protein
VPSASVRNTVTCAPALRRTHVTIWCGITPRFLALATHAASRRRSVCLF